MKQRGFTLVELMIVCSCMVILAPIVTNFFLTSLQTQRRIGELARNQQQAQLWFDLLGRDVRMAAHVTITGQRIVLQPSGTAWNIEHDQLVRRANATSRAWDMNHTAVEFSGQTDRVTMRCQRPAARTIAGWELHNTFVCRVTQ